MSTMQRQQRDAVTKNFEGKEQFYADADSKTGAIQYNFGYGYNLNKNPDWAGVLATAGISNNIITQIQTAMNSSVKDAATRNASTDVKSINASLADLPNIQNIKQTVLDDYFIKKVDPILQTLLPPPYSLSALPDGILSALEDMTYNSGTRFMGDDPRNSAIAAAILEGLTTGDYSEAAYQLAFNTAPANFNTVGQLGYARRVTANALTALGLTVTLNGNHVVTSVSGDASNSEIVNFLRSSITADSRYLSLGTPANSALTVLGAYTADRGYYVSQKGDTLSSIQAKILLTEGQLPLLLDSTSTNVSADTLLLPGTIVLVPTSAVPINDNGLGIVYSYGFGNYDQQLTNYTSGNSTLKYFSPTDGILNETKYYTGLDGTGWNTKNYINLLDGTSLMQDFGMTPSGGGAGGIGTSWQLTPSGALANPHTIFQGSDALPSPNDGAALQSFKDAASTAVGIWNAIGPIDNSLFPNLSVLKFTGTQDAPPASAEFSTIAANGALLLGADYLAQYPNANTDGLFSNAAASTIAGGWRIAAQELLKPPDNIASLLGTIADGFDAALNFSRGPVATLPDLVLGAPVLKNVDPLLLDLTGQGIRLSNWIDNSIYFRSHVKADGTADEALHHTSWVLPGTAIVALDLNGDGKINDITETLSEYFRGGANMGHYADGLGALAGLAAANDNILQLRQVA